MIGSTSPAIRRYSKKDVSKVRGDNAASLDFEQDFRVGARSGANEETADDG
jgi:hypothetical protein